MTRRQKSAFAAGLMMGGAFFLIRLASAETYGDVLLSIALALAELSVVWMLERSARRMEPDIEACSVHNKNVDQAETLVRTEEEDLARHERLIDAAESGMMRIEQQFENDHVLGDAKALTTIAVNAVRSGYRCGIETNRGEIGGTPRPGEAA